MTEIDGSEVNSVNSRDIYEYLGVSTKYADWIKRAIDKYDFEEGTDFIASQKREASGQMAIDYIVTLDMAKELCMIDGEPWFVAKDVCDALGISNVSQALSRLDEDEKNTIILTDSIKTRGNPNMAIINESGLYSVILTSRKQILKIY